MDTVPDLNIINVPYLFLKSFEKKSKLLHTEWFQGLNNELSDKGLKLSKFTQSTVLATYFLKGQ